jgi:hypothetical protein
MISEEFNRQFDLYTRYAFRFESFQEYVVEGEREEFEQWKRTRYIPDKGVRPWQKRMAARIQKGATMQRVRIVVGKPSEYLEFETLAAYSRNLIAGDQIRVLEVAAIQAVPSHLDHLYDYWLFDDRIAYEMDYDIRGKYRKESRVTDEAVIEQMIKTREDLLAKSVPIKESILGRWVRE